MFRSPTRSSSGSFYFLVEVTEFKFTKNIKDLLWLCGGIGLVCLHYVLRGVVSWTQLTTPRITQLDSTHNPTQYAVGLNSQLHAVRSWTQLTTPRSTQLDSTQNSTQYAVGLNSQPHAVRSWTQLTTPRSTQCRHTRLCCRITTVDP
jgi:hypothetical protein